MTKTTLQQYLSSQNIITNRVRTRNIKSKNSILVRLLISTKYENVLKFTENIEFNYCSYKAKKLQKTLSDFTNVKHKRYNDLLKSGKSPDEAINLLQLSEQGLIHIISPKNPLETDN